MVVVVLMAWWCGCGGCDFGGVGVVVVVVVVIVVWWWLLRSGGGGGDYSLCKSGSCNSCRSAMVVLGVVVLVV